MVENEVLFPASFQVDMSVSFHDSEDMSDSEGVEAGVDFDDSESEVFSVVIACSETTDLREFTGRLTDDYLRNLAAGCTGMHLDAIISVDLVRVEEAALPVAVLPPAEATH